MTGNFNHQPLKEYNLQQVEVEGKRFYNVDGELFPSVTTVLSSLSKRGIQEWRQRVGEEAANKITKAATSRGTKVHSMCEDYVNNKPEYKNNRMPTTVELFNQIKPYLDENLEVVYAIEGSLYSKKLKAAGKCDLICRMHGVNCIVDYKTSTKPKTEEYIESYFLQETAYAMMVEEMYNLPIFYIITLIAVEEGNLQFFVKRPHDYEDKVINLFQTYHANRK